MANIIERGFGIFGMEARRKVAIAIMIAAALGLFGLINFNTIAMMGISWNIIIGVLLALSAYWAFSQSL